uniref:Uncharacterized protein n=2 Tax=Caenorhabditis japonica TaxID=281687 RepID=A0A8R1DZK6_CAEJA
MSAIIVSKSKREKTAGMSEYAAFLLVELYIRDSKLYHSRLESGSKRSKTPRQQCLEEWQKELSAIGCERTTEQIHQRMKGDIITTKARLAAEEAEKSKTGGVDAENFPKLDLARTKLYEHLSSSHEVEGVIGGIESDFSDEILNLQKSVLVVKLENAKIKQETLIIERETADILRQIAYVEAERLGISTLSRSSIPSSSKH